MSRIILTIDWLQLSYMRMMTFIEYLQLHFNSPRWTFEPFRLNIGCEGDIRGTNNNKIIVEDKQDSVIYRTNVGSTVRK